MKITISIMKNTVEGTNNRSDKAEDQISNFEDRVKENTYQSSKIFFEKRIFKNEDILRDCWDNIDYNNIHIMGVPE